MAERKFISDEEWERRFDEKIEAERIRAWEEYEREHPDWRKEWIAESNRKFAECNVGTGWNNNKPQKVQSRVLNGCNDKWGHGDMFYEQFKEDLIEEESESVNE